MLKVLLFNNKARTNAPKTSETALHIADEDFVGRAHTPLCTRPLEKEALTYAQFHCVLDQSRVFTPGVLHGVVEAGAVAPSSFV